MKTFVGVDYHKAFSDGTIMNESGQILEQGRAALRGHRVTGPEG